MTGLETLKSNIGREYLYLVISDPDVKRLILGWTLSMPHAPLKDAPVAKAEPMDATLSRLWEQVQPHLDFDELAGLSGLPRQTVMAKIALLMRARLIFPDRTAAAEAMAIIRGEVGTALRSLTRGTQ